LQSPESRNKKRKRGGKTKREQLKEEREEREREREREEVEKREQRSSWPGSVLSGRRSRTEGPSVEINSALVHRNIAQVHTHAQQHRSTQPISQLSTSLKECRNIAIRPMEEAAIDSLPQQDAEPGKAPPERK
jgi:hypothetical protein